MMPNAYKGKKSALNNQLLAYDEHSLQFANNIYKGAIDSILWKINGIEAKTYQCKDTADVEIIALPELLSPGNTVRLETNFYVKLPSTHISRMGYKNSSYYITQWYPKPAVYDEAGWHPLSYLDQGEFFSEYGDYEVQITVPQNFVVAATGDLTTEEEIKNLDTLAAFSSKYIHPKKRKDLKKEIIASSKTKTLIYKIDNVHDFAFCADPELLIMKDTVRIDGREVLLQSFVKMSHWSDWQQSNIYLKQAIEFFSDEIGPYPFKTFSIVDVDDITGGDMEYPTIAWINNSYSIEETIAHEVGHNWFYSVLGSNERDEHWLDEGVNTFYENKYLLKKYPDAKVHFHSSLLDGNNFPLYQQSHTEYYSIARFNDDQPTKTTSHLLSEENYWIQAYSKPAAYLTYLEAICGKELFHQVIKEYYETWKFKHPTATDLHDIFKKHLGEKADWFFEDAMITNNKVDYKITKVKKTGDQFSIEISNQGELSPPIAIQTYDNSYRLLETYQFDPINLKGNVDIPFDPNISWISLDKDMTLPDIYLKDNYVMVKNGKEKMKPTRFNFFSSFENPFRKHIYYLPGISFNYYDGPQIGITFHNYGLLPKPTEWFVLPMLATRSLRPSFLGGIRHTHYFKKNSSDRFVITTNGSFQSYNESSGTPLWSILISPHFKLMFERRDIYSPISHEVGLKNQLLITQVDPSLLLDHRIRCLMQNILYYKMSYKKRLWQVENTVSFEHTNDFGINYVNAPLTNITPALKLFNEFKVTYTYFKNKSAIQLRIFAGTFLTTPNMVTDTRFRLSGWRGIWDYAFNDYYLARSEPLGFFSQQVGHADGDFKINTFVGQSNFWMLTANLEWDVPMIYAGVFMDVGTFQYAGAAAPSPAFVYSGGIYLRTPDRTLQIYFPIIYSPDIKSSVQLNYNSYWETIRFTLQLQNFQFIKKIRKLFI